MPIMALGIFIFLGISFVFIDRHDRIRLREDLHEKCLLKMVADIVERDNPYHLETAELFGMLNAKERLILRAYEALPKTKFPGLTKMVTTGLEEARVED